MAKRYLNTIVSLLKTSSPNTQVNPSNGNNTAEALRPTFAFLNVDLAGLIVVSVLALVVFFARVSLTSLDDKAVFKAGKKIMELI